MYYIKKLGRQEMGSPTPEGKISRGRYLYIPKETNGFFPHLSTTELNDKLILPIIKPNSNSKVYCKFVYHNSKFHDTDEGIPRNEFRIYLNKNIDPDRSFFMPEDILVFTKTEIESEIDLYQIHLLREKDDKYEFLEQIISDSDLKGNHAIFDDQIDFIEANLIQNDETETIVPAEIVKEIESDQVEETKGAKLFNSVSFRDFVLLGYQYKCAISNQVIAYNKLMNLQAAHIKPKAHSGSFLPCNGIALSQDLHWAFDKGMFTINDDYKVIVHDEIDSNLLKQYENQIINLPIEDFFKPDKTFLKHHRDKIFGLFKHSGSIRSI